MSRAVPSPGNMEHAPLCVRALRSSAGPGAGRGGGLAEPAGVAASPAPAKAARCAVMLGLALAAVPLLVSSSRAAADNGKPPRAEQTEQERDGETTADLTTSGGDSENDVRLTQQAQPQPIAPVPMPIQTAPQSPAAATELAAAVFGTGTANLNLLSDQRRNRARGAPSDVVLGAESRFRAATDAGSLLGRSTQTPGIVPQKRTPIVTDTRVRGSGVGNLLASGSYWIPARQDMDTLLSKIDSRIISDVIVINGPYSTRYGPGAAFVDVNLLGSPRFYGGFEVHESTSAEYQTNGQHWYGRETVWGGDDVWGFRVGYGHRTGNDYEMGNGETLPTSYISRDLDVALGYDLSEDSHIEFSYLRLDQTDVEFPGIVWDLNFLVTDAYEVTYVLQNQTHFDMLTAEAWYNRTRFVGNADRSGKRMQIPDVNILTESMTDGDTMSTGFALATTWGVYGAPQLSTGVDLRYVKQELNELVSFEVPGAFVITDGSAPIPRSHEANPGLFTELLVPVNDCLTITAGARVDWVSANTEGDNPPGLTTTVPQVPITDDGIIDFLLGSSADRDWALWAAYISAEYQWDCHWTAGVAAGHSMRPPTLTELYADGALLQILQGGFNAVLGDPNLDPSRHTQLDVSLWANYDRFRGGIRGFHQWAQDFITEELTFASQFVDNRTIRFVNTPLATLAGGEIYGEYDLNCWLTPFGLLSYVEGRDHSRSKGGRTTLLGGDTLALDEFRLEHDPNLSRGVRPGSDEEPLPGIPPLESRVGVRLHPPCDTPNWGVEFSARIVHKQDRVASSLGELPTAGFTTYDIRSFWNATDNLSFTAGVENLTDKFYREHLDARTGRGVFQPGISFYFGTELVF